MATACEQLTAVAMETTGTQGSGPTVSCIRSSVALQCFYAIMLVMGGVRFLLLCVGMRDGYGRMLFDDFVVCKDKDSGATYYDYDRVYTGNWQLNRYRMRGMTSALPAISHNEDYNYYTTHNLDRKKYPWLWSLAQKEEDLEAKLTRVCLLVELH